METNNKYKFNEGEEVKMNNYNLGRRGFLKSVGLVIGGGMVTIRGFSANTYRSARNKLKEVRVPFTRTIEKKYVDIGRKLGIGHAEITAPDKVKVNTWATVDILYTAGKAGISPGGGIRYTMMHHHSWLPFQCDDPKAPSYVSAVASNGSTLKLKCFVNRPWNEILPSREWRLYDPYYNYIEIKVEDHFLEPGDTIRLILGDRSFGSPGVFTQYYTEDKFTFETYVNPDAKDVYYPFADADHPRIEVVNDKACRISVVAPANTVSGEAGWCIVRAEDRFGNPAREFTGKVKVTMEGNGKELFSHTFSPEDRGAYRFKNLRLTEKGVVHLVARHKEWTARSNPIVVTETAPKKKLFWGDIHNHTRFSDGRGTFEQSYQYGRDFAGLDFCAVSDHAENLKDHEWEASVRVTNAFNKPGDYVTFNAYEWSGKEDVGGDHNVYFPDDNPPPVYRSRANFNYESFNNYQGQEMQMNHIEDLYIALMKHYKHKDIIVIPHWGGREGNPLWHYPELERMIEVYSDHRRSEDWVTTYLTAGHRVGIMASSDNHLGKPGYSDTFPKSGRYDNIDWEREEIGTSLIAVYAEEKTRASIFEAIYDRRCYASTGARIVLNFQLNGNPMGSEIYLDRTPVLKVEVIGTDVIERIEIKKNSEVAYSFKPGKPEASMEWKDPDFDPDKSAYYYVRVVQKDSEEAISSPVWVN